MAAKLGILGESTDATSGTVTVYTVPADKAARIRILFMVERGANVGNYAIYIGSPGTEHQITSEGAANEDAFSGSRRIATPDPLDSLIMGVNGMQQQAGALGDMDSTTITVDYIVAPLSADYFLSTGDTVKFSNVDSVTDHLIQVIGVEDDA